MIGLRGTLSALVALVGIGLVGCERTDEAPRRYNTSLGGGAPPVRGALVDRGILADQTAYQPAVAEGGGGPRGGDESEEKAARGGGDAEAAVRQVVDKLLDAMDQNDFEAILELCNPEQVAALKGNHSALIESGEKARFLEKIISEKFGEEMFAQAKAGASQFLKNLLKIEVIDESNANVVPNLVAAVFGPKAAGAAMTLGKSDDGWRIQLSGPLTEEDVTAIIAFHEALKGALEKLIEQVEAGEQPNLAAIIAAVQQAMGAPSAGDAGEADGEKPDEKADDAGEDKGNDNGSRLAPEPGGVRGGRRPRGVP
jgi:hypothetical protein